MVRSEFYNVRENRGGRLFNPRLGQYSFRGLMIVIVTGFIPLSPLSVVSTMVMWESSHRLAKNIVRSTGKKNSRKAWIGALAAVITEQACVFTCPLYKSFENSGGKGEIARNEQFFLLPQRFLPI